MPVVSKVLDLKADESLKTLVNYNVVDENSNIISLIESGKTQSTFIWGYEKKKYLIAKVDNACESECSYTGFENNDVNEWVVYGDNKITSEFALSGKNSILVNNGFGPTKRLQVGLNAKNHNGYQASVWVKGDTRAYLHIEANDYHISQRVENSFDDDKWHLLKVELPIDRFEDKIDANLIISAYIGNEGEIDTYFDDLRVYPMDAQMTTYTYEPMVGVTSVSDINNKPEIYDYDGFGRLKHIWDFEGNIKKNLEYHYKN